MIVRLELIWRNIALDHPILFAGFFIRCGLPCLLDENQKSAYKKNPSIHFFFDFGSGILQVVGNG